MLEKFPTKNHLDALLALRGFACLMVVNIHCNPPRNAIIYQSYNLSWLTFSHGPVAVWIFFVLSGYLMGKAFYTERYTADVQGVLNFWRNRAIRILPLYYFAVFILCLFVYTEIFKVEYWGYLIRVCTFTYHSQMVSQQIAFDYALWSLSTEIQFYILIPFIYNLFRHRLINQKYILLTAVCVIGVTFVLKLIAWISFRNQISEQMEYAFKYWYTPLSNNLELFLCGFLINPLLKYHHLNILKNSNNFKWLNSSKKNISVILLLVLYLFSAYHLYHQELWGLIGRPSGWRTSTTIFILQPLTAIITSFFIFAFESEDYYGFTKNEKLSFATLLRNPFRILEILGNLSYGIYIWHMPIIVKITPVFTSDIPIEAFYNRLTATTILSTALAVITYYLVEIPATRWKIYRSSQNIAHQLIKEKEISWTTKHKD